jgi:hypothetical protein
MLVPVRSKKPGQGLLRYRSLPSEDPAYQGPHGTVGGFAGSPQGGELGGFSRRSFAGTEGVKTPPDQLKLGGGTAPVAALKDREIVQYHGLVYTMEGGSIQLRLFKLRF